MCEGKFGHNTLAHLMFSYAPQKKTNKSNFFTVMLLGNKEYIIQLKTVRCGVYFETVCKDLGI